VSQQIRVSTIYKFIKTHKDKNQHLDNNNNNVIYKINCNDCDVSYVEQTKRQLGTRVKEQWNNVRSIQTFSSHKTLLAPIITLIGKMLKF